MSNTNTTAAITLQTEGRRIYLLGNTYPVKDSIKAAGGHWDAERRAWWLSTAKKGKAEAIAASAANAGGSQAASRPSDDAPGESAVVAGTARYKGKVYYIAGRKTRSGYAGYGSRSQDAVEPVENRDGDKYLLYARNGAFQFWASQAACEVVKEYQSPQTIGGLKAFMERVRTSEAQGSSYQADHGWRSNGCAECRRLQDWCPRCAFDEFDN